MLQTWFVTILIMVIFTRLSVPIERVYPNTDPLHYVENVWSNGTLSLFQDMFRSSSISDLPSDDMPDSEFDNIGEERDPNSDNKCPFKYTLNKLGNKWYVNEHNKI